MTLVCPLRVAPRTYCAKPGCGLIAVAGFSLAADDGSEPLEAGFCEAHAAPLQAVITAQARKSRPSRILAPLLRVAACVAVVGAGGAIVAAGLLAWLWLGHSLDPVEIATTLNRSVDVALVGIGAFALLLVGEVVLP